MLYSWAHYEPSLIFKCLNVQQLLLLLLFNLQPIINCFDICCWFFWFFSWPINDRSDQMGFKERPLIDLLLITDWSSLRSQTELTSHHSKIQEKLTQYKIIYIFLMAFHLLKYLCNFTHFCVLKISFIFYYTARWHWHYKLGTYIYIYIHILNKTIF